MKKEDIECILKTSGWYFHLLQQTQEQPAERGWKFYPPTHKKQN